MITRTSYINNHNMLLSNDEIKRMVDMRLDFSNSTIINNSVSDSIRRIWLDEFLPQNRELNQLQAVANRNSQITNDLELQRAYIWPIDYVYNKNRQVIYPSWDMSDMIIIDEAVNNAIEENIWEWDIWNE